MQVASHAPVLWSGWSSVVSSTGPRQSRSVPPQLSVAQAQGTVGEARCSRPCFSQYCTVRSKPRPDRMLEHTGEPGHWYKRGLRGQAREGGLRHPSPCPLQRRSSPCRSPTSAGFVGDLKTLANGVLKHVKTVQELCDRSKHDVFVEPKPAAVSLQNLAYVIYTSGSTGKPKVWGPLQQPPPRPNVRGGGGAGWMGCVRSGYARWSL